MNLMSNLDAKLKDIYELVLSDKQKQLDSYKSLKELISREDVDINLFKSQIETYIAVCCKQIEKLKSNKPEYIKLLEQVKLGSVAK